jgi:cytochrome c-type biogenesis protein CcmH
MRIQALLRMSLLLNMLLMSLSAPAWSQTWQDIAGDLMSPACPGRTLLNCTSGQAEQWRELVRQKLAQGESKEQILRYFVEIGGEGILAAPPKQGFALTAWLLPLFVMLNGAGLIVVLTRRWARKRPQAHAERMADYSATAPAAHQPSDPYLDRLHRELKEFDK